MSDDENSSNRQQPTVPSASPDHSTRIFGSAGDIHPHDSQTRAALLRSLCDLLWNQRELPPQQGDRNALFSKLGRLWVAFGSGLGRLWVAFGRPPSQLFDPLFQPLGLLWVGLGRAHSFERRVAFGNPGWHQTALFRTKRHQIHFFKPVRISAEKCRWVPISAEKCRSPHRNMPAERDVLI